MKAIDLKPYASSFSGYTDLRCQRNTMTSIKLLNGDVAENSQSVTAGVSARCCRNGVWGFASRPEFSSAAIAGTIDEASANARALAAHHQSRYDALPRVKGENSSDYATRKARRSRESVIDYARQLDAHIAASYPGLRARQIGISGLDMEKHLRNSQDSENYSNTTRAILYVMLFGENAAGQPVNVMEGFGGRGQFEDWFDEPAELNARIDRLYEHLQAKCAGVAARSGVQEVVLGSDLAGILAHEAVGHTTEADIVSAGSVARDLVGQQVASELITLVDYANTRNGETLPVPVFIDDEGTPARDQVLIRDGVLQGFMHDKQSSLIYGAEPTGNARAFQFFDEPLIRMRNTAIESGRSKLEDMIASVEDGYYLMWPGNGQADTTGEFMFAVRLGYEIKDGKLGRAITDTTISGVAFDMLKSVTMVSDEMKWSVGGMCGKKQLITVGMGGPSIRCRVHVGGGS